MPVSAAAPTQVYYASEQVNTRTLENRNTRTLENHTSYIQIMVTFLS